MEIELKKVTTGNFSYDVSLSLNDKVVTALLKRGVKSALQNAISEWKREIAYPTVNGVKAKIPKGFEIKSIEYNKANADLLEKYIGLCKVDVADDDAEEKELADLGVMDVANIIEYLGSTAPPKYSDQKQFVMWYLFQEDGKTPKTLTSGGPRTVESFASNRGIDAPTEPWAEDTTFLQSVKEWQIEEKKKQADKE